MTLVSSVIIDASKLDNLKDGVIVRLKTEYGTSRCEVAESAPTGRVWRVSGASDCWTSDDLLDLGWVVVLHVPED